MSYAKMLLQSKGGKEVWHRLQAIIKRYGLTPTKMTHALERFIRLLDRHGCRATFPVTARTLARNPALFRSWQAQGIEFAVHGLAHTDLSQRSYQEQMAHIAKAAYIFSQQGVEGKGYRSPYLRHSESIRTAIEAQGFLYESNQPVLWDVVRGVASSAQVREAYQRAVAFYEPLPGKRWLSVPRLQGNLVTIPVSLPDDEMLVERLKLQNSAHIAGIWQRILAETYRHGELFTLQLHPERIVQCEAALDAVLSEARARHPAIWIARLDEIADWWTRKQAAQVTVEAVEKEAWRISVEGPSDLRVLARGFQVMGATQDWADGYQLVLDRSFIARAARKPLIGITPDTPASQVDFLRAQGYLIEVSDSPNAYSLYLGRAALNVEDERVWIEDIEGTDTPLVRLGRWPDGARSALAITGDIDALTLWDYGLRLVGR